MHRVQPATLFIAFYQYNRSTEIALMATSLDLNLITIARQGGQELAELPGLSIAMPPRRPARSRGDDRLVMYLSLSGNAPLSEGRLEQVLSALAKKYYETPGSVTAALRAAAEALNQHLLDRNVGSAGSGLQSYGLLAMVVLRGEQLYLARSGEVQAFWINAAQVQHIYEPEITERGLGLKRPAPLHFFQATPQAGDTLLLARRPSPTWGPATLAGLHGQGPEGIRRRLPGRSEPELEAVVLQARPGSGKVTLLRLPPTPSAELRSEPLAAETLASAAVASPAVAPEPAQPPDLAAPDLAAPDLAAPDLATATALAAAGLADAVPPVAASSAAAPQAEVLATLPPEAAHAPTAEPFVTPAQATTAEQPPPPVAPAAAAPTVAAPAPPRARPQRPARQGFSLSRLFAEALLGLAMVMDSFKRGLSVTWSRVSPKRPEAEAEAQLSTGSMAAISILVPLVVVGLASVVYLASGREDQFQSYFDKARESALQAVNQPDPLAQNTLWQSTLEYLDQAENYRLTSDSQGLRSQAQLALDQLNLVQRVEYRSAIIGGLPEDSQITRILVVGGDLYLLDSVTGSVTRALDTSSLDYEVDLGFQCSPTYSPLPGFGAIIDIAPSTSTAEGAVLVGIDAKGNVMRCFLDQAPEVGSLTRPPAATNWGNLAGMTVDIDLGHIYVLDPPDNAVWVYWYGRIDQEPQYFFGNVAPNVQDVIDLAVNRYDLYLLHADGRTTWCVFSELIVAPTTCNDPSPYIDYRPGRENTTFYPPSPFTQILYVPPPDPSLYYLEPTLQSIYHFSLRSLGFQKQFQPAVTLPGGPATAFAVSNFDRLLFLAAGSQVYSGEMP
jgi:hypothetical protein